jgi:hypothetical protein
MAEVKPSRNPDNEFEREITLERLNIVNVDELKGNVTFSVRITSLTNRQFEELRRILQTLNFTSMEQEEVHAAMHDIGVRKYLMKHIR